MRTAIAILFIALPLAAQNTSSVGPGSAGPIPISSLPAASSYSGKTFLVLDGASGSDCTTGGGSYLVPCKSNGTIWVAQNVGNATIAPNQLASNENVTFSATPTFSVATRSSLITLSSNITSFTLAAGSDGQEKTLTFCQNSTGGYTVTPPANVRGFFSAASTANKCGSQHFTYYTSQTAWLADNPGVLNQ